MNDQQAAALIAAVMQGLAIALGPDEDVPSDEQAIMEAFLLLDLARAREAELARRRSMAA